MSVVLDGTSGITTPGVVNTAGETIATTLAVTGASTLTGAVTAATTLAVTGVTTLTGGLNTPLAVLQGGTGVTTSTGTGSNVLSASPTFTGTPLSTTAASATNTTQIATTAFAYGTLSNSTSGYVKLPNGLILQWGTTGSLGSPSTTTITLPIAFPTTFHNVGITRNTTSLAASYTAAVVKSTLSTFIVYNNGIACAQMWTAVGI